MKRKVKMLLMATRAVAPSPSNDVVEVAQAVATAPPPSRDAEAASPQHN